MSADGRQERTDLGGMTRRELVSALARWTVPTVLTLSLGVRSAYAAASCPPEVSAWLFPAACVCSPLG